jgi:hypothetical protein
MTTHPQVPLDARTKESAYRWASDMWSRAPRTRTCVVWFPLPNPKGRRTKPSIEKARLRFRGAIKQGDFADARKTIADIEHLGGVAWCNSCKELARVLEERIRYQQTCYEEDCLTDELVWLSCWREK